MRSKSALAIPVLTFSLAAVAAAPAAPAAAPARKPVDAAAFDPAVKPSEDL